MGVTALRAESPGFGLGLRTPHYPDFLARRQQVDWLEIITDNFLVEGGKPLAMLDRVRRDYPVALHGVAMSLGAPGGPDAAYLRRVKALADRVQPLWVSDHLCWIGPGPEQRHDLYPLPYTEEAARRVIAAIGFAQDLLQRRLVVENVSSYVGFADSACAEWQFLSHVAQQADCLLLVDVNNIHVSSVNHRFDPLHYLDGLPAGRVQQIHLAGHADHGDHIVDTHDHPVAPAVWALYRQACARFGGVATMIERDDRIPPLQELLAELDQARAISAAVGDASVKPHAEAPAPAGTPPLLPASDTALPLSDLQRGLCDFILARANEQVLAGKLRAPDGVDLQQRLHIYHHAYRMRLAEVLADSFARTAHFMGSDLFESEAIAFAVEQPPLLRSLGRYGAQFPAHLQQRYPGNPELNELAQLDWDLRACFDGPDVAALDAQAAAQDHAQAWVARLAPLHPSVRLRSVTTNAVALWNALDQDAEVPPVHTLAQPRSLAVWRKGQQPHFQSLEAGQDAFIACLARGCSILQACEELQGLPQLAQPNALALWLRQWWDDGLLRGDRDPATS
jgi:uncharacterized protein (UPF0276 family)